MAQKKPQIPWRGLDYTFLRLPLNAPKPEPENLRIGVFIHAFYETEIFELLPLLDHIGLPFRLFLTTDTPAKRAFLLEKLTPRYGEALSVSVFDNRGRDIAPKFVGLADAQLSCDLVLHLHAKKSLHRSELGQWRDFLLDSLLGSPQICADILALFANQPELGVVAPRIFRLVHRAVHWRDNYCTAAYLARRMGVKITRDTPADFPAGSMFWARPAALKPLFDLNLGFGAFEPEAGQVDGTLGHAIERLFFYAAASAGYKSLHIGVAGAPEPFETEVGMENIDAAFFPAP